MARQMKDSGIEWIGEIPETWRIAKIKNSFVIYAGATPKSENSENFDGQITWITPADYKTNDVYVGEGKRNLSEEGYKSCGTTIVPAGSIIFSKRAPIGTVAIASKELCTNQGCLSCVNKGKANEKYFYYNMSICGEEFNLLGTGTTFKEISAFNFANFSLPLPTNEEQKRISNFLDQQCAHIDTVIEKTKASIEEYKKLKQAVITEAVTKGVRGERPMKDSGIEWIGEIPADWDDAYAFQIFKPVKCKNTGLVEKNLLSLSYGKIKRKSIDTVGGLLPENFDGYNIIERDDIVLRLTDLQNDHKSLRVGLATERGIVTSAYLTLRNTSDMLPEYLYFYLHSYDVAKGFYGMGAGVRQGLNWEELKHLQITVPSVDEQKEIIKYLSSESEKLDDLITKKEAFLGEMETYKKSLIYEYVTGKREVPQCQ